MKDIHFSSFRSKGSVYSNLLIHLFGKLADRHAQLIRVDNRVQIVTKWQDKTFQLNLLAGKLLVKFTCIKETDKLN